MAVDFPNTLIVAISATVCLIWQKMKPSWLNWLPKIKITAARKFQAYQQVRENEILDKAQAIL